MWFFGSDDEEDDDNVGSVHGSSIAVNERGLE